MTNNRHHHHRRRGDYYPTAAAFPPPYLGDSGNAVIGIIVSKSRDGSY